ncbi:MAG: PAS domain-containing protein, partial [Flavobacteriales bacterium]
MMELDALKSENERLRERLSELAQALEAIRDGEVDALVDGSHVFALGNAEMNSNNFRGQVLEQIEDVVVAVDLDDRITYINAAAEKKYGRRASEVLGSPLSAMYTQLWVPPEEENKANRAWARGDTWRGEKVHLMPSGERITVEATVCVLHDNAGRPIGRLGVLRDIGERILAQRALEESVR